MILLCFNIPPRLSIRLALEPSSFDHRDGMVIIFSVNDAVIILQNKIASTVFESNSYARAESVMEQVFLDSIEQAHGRIGSMFRHVVRNDLAANRQTAD